MQMVEEESYIQNVQSLNQYITSKKQKNMEVSRISILFINTEKKWLKEWKIIAFGE